MKENQDNRGNSANDGIVLSRHLALCGIASRRKATDLVRAGHVAVNGNRITDPGFRVGPGMQVEFDGRAVKPETNVYIMLNKPVGYVCTRDDPHAEKTVFDLVTLPKVRLFHVGRLDRDSEGLLLLTNDGDFAARVTHPRYEIEKRYEVEVSHPMSREEIQRICTGIQDGDDFLQALSVRPLKAKVYEFVMREGKKREIRRLLQAVGKKTVRLRRFAIGGLLLTNLEVGCWRQLDPREAGRCLEPFNLSSRKTVPSSPREAGRPGQRHRSRIPFP